VGANALKGGEVGSLAGAIPPGGVDTVKTILAEPCRSGTGIAEFAAPIQLASCGKHVSPARLQKKCELPCRCE
jgi:hypothetical protein